MNSARADRLNLEKQISDAPRPIYPLEYALKNSPFPAIIAECKKQSPSAGVIRSPYDPVAISESYFRSGAVAISVLTDTDYFGGSLSDLSQVSDYVSIPTIRKDFIIDEIQILEARANGASGILLIARILDPNQMKSLLSFSRQLGMEALVETHTKEEILTSLEIGAKIIGINTRDLDTFQIHHNLISDLAPYIPKECIRIGESGIHSREDWESLRGIVDGLLVGTYFMKAENIDSAFQDLFSVKN